MCFTEKGAHEWVFLWLVWCPLHFLHPPPASERHRTKHEQLKLTNTVAPMVVSPFDVKLNVWGYGGNMQRHQNDCMSPTYKYKITLKTDQDLQMSIFKKATRDYTWISVLVLMCVFTRFCLCISSFKFIFSTNCCTLKKRHETGVCSFTIKPRLLFCPVTVTVMLCCVSSHVFAPLFLICSWSMALWGF